MTRSPGAASAAAGARSHRLRIVGGQWKRTPIAVPDVAGLRPTPDRVRETLFNWLGQKLGARRCLDLFAGTGALGFEAASRGAEQVVLVERDRRAAAAIAATIERLRAPGVRLVVGDAFDALNRLAQSGEAFDAPAGWHIEREGRAGQVRYYLLSRQAEASAADASPGTDA